MFQINNKDTEACLEPCKTLRMERCHKNSWMVKSHELPPQKSSVIDVWQNVKYTSETAQCIGILAFIVNFEPTLAHKYMLKVNNRNTRKSCEMCSKLPLKITKRRYWRCYWRIVNFEPILQIFLVYLLLAFNR